MEQASGNQRSTSIVVRILGWIVVALGILGFTYAFYWYVVFGMTTWWDFFNLFYCYVFTILSVIGLVALLGLMTRCRLSRHYSVPFGGLAGTLGSLAAMPLTYEAWKAYPEDLSRMIYSSLEAEP